MSEAKVIFTCDGISSIIKCSEEDIMKDICQKFALKIDKSIYSFMFLYEGEQVNYNSIFKELAIPRDRKNNEMKITVHKIKNNFISYPKYQEIFEIKKGNFNELILSYDNIRDELYKTKIHIEQIIKNSKSNQINNQLKNINDLIKKINEDIKNNNEKLKNLLNHSNKNNKNIINHISEKNNNVKNELDNILKDNDKEEIIHKKYLKDANYSLSKNKLDNIKSRYI